MKTWIKGDRIANEMEKRKQTDKISSKVKKILSPPGSARSCRHSQMGDSDSALPFHCFFGVAQDAIQSEAIRGGGCCGKQYQGGT